MPVARNDFIVPTKPEKSDSSKITVLILGSIPGVRMRSMPAISLMAISAKQNVIESQLHAIKITFPQSEIVLTAGHNIEEVIRTRPKNIRIVENQNYETYNETEEIRIGLNNVVTESVIIVPGNCIFNSVFLNQIRNHGSCTMYSKKEQMDNDTLGIIDTNGRLENIAYGVNYTWYPILFLTGRELTIYRNYINNRSRGNMCYHESLSSICGNCNIYSIESRLGYFEKITGKPK